MHTWNIDVTLKLSYLSTYFQGKFNFHGSFWGAATFLAPQVPDWPKSVRSLFRLSPCGEPFHRDQSHRQHMKKITHVFHFHLLLWMDLNLGLYFIVGIIEMHLIQCASSVCILSNVHLRIVKGSCKESSLGEKEKVRHNVENLAWVIKKILPGSSKMVP